MTILLLPFGAFQEGDEVAAKLGRQLPRRMGAELEDAFSQVRVKFLSARGVTRDGSPGLVASVELPPTSELINLAEMYDASAVVVGRLAINDRGVSLEAHVFSRASKRVVFDKRYDVYPTYFFDALEEIKLRIVQSLAIESTDEERVRLFRRVTESWQAYLFFLLAEDERYGLTVGITPGDLTKPIELYEAALETDPFFERAQSALIEYVLLLVEDQEISVTMKKVVLHRARKAMPESVFQSLEELVSGATPEGK